METCSLFSSLEAVWLGMGAWHSWFAPMLLSLSVFVSSKEQAVATYYNNNLDELEQQKKKRFTYQREIA